VFYKLRRLMLILWPLGLVAQSSPTMPPMDRPATLEARRIDEPPYAKDAWQYVRTCSHRKPRKHHDLNAVVWMVGNVTEAYLVVSDRREYVSAIYVADDTIVIDTGWVMEPIVAAHELFHHINGQVPKEREHPDFPMAFPCRLMSWQYPEQQEGPWKINSPRGFIIRMNRIVREAAPFDTLPTPTP
jgi:hypothetical protein